MKPIAAVPHRPPVGTWRRPEALREPMRPAAAAAAPAATPLGAAETSKLSFFLFLALTYAVVGRPNDYILALVPLHIALVMTLITTLVTVLEGRNGGRSPFEHRESKLFLTLYAAMFVGVPFAMHRGVTFDLVVMNYPSTILFFFLFLTHVTSQERLRQVIWVIVVGAFLFTAIGLVQGTMRANRFFVGSGMYDPNDVAYVQLALLPFSLCILFGKESGLVRRSVAITTALLGLLVALYTGSRGGLVGLLTFLLLFVNLKIGVMKPIHKILLVAVCAAVVAWNVDKINTERFMTLTNIQEDYNYGAEWGRTDVWKNGIVLFLQDPLTGVGANNFSMAIGNRRGSLGLLPKWQAPHNTFVQILAEIGIVGFVAFVMLVIASGKTFWRLRKSEAQRNPQLAVWAGLIFAGFIAQTLSATFLTMGYSIFFSVYFAMSATLRRLAEGSPAVEETEPPKVAFASRRAGWPRGHVSEA